ncbi:MAG TPA: AAA family ATPase [Gammaproteobacteria bacterium]|nr:AAA family ATPase [Gammaproteobacteria bacterium]
MNRLLRNTMDAMGLPSKQQSPDKPITRYRIDILNTDIEIDTLLLGLKRHPHARLCFYGVPGTGKTALGRYIADQLHSSLLVSKASDLLGPHVGETERRIRNMFQEAKYAGSVLLLDEADSFLRKREHARYSWELTQVNEMLTQMEAFDGVFICSTNLMDSLDKASLRRFDFKIKFDYLRPGQAWQMFEQILEEHQYLIEKPAVWKQRLAGLGNLTPGDFTVAVRQHRLLGRVMDAEWLFDSLAAEVRMKGEKQKRGIGFLAAV